MRYITTAILLQNAIKECDCQGQRKCVYINMVVGNNVNVFTYT